MFFYSRDEHCASEQLSIITEALHHVLYVVKLVNGLKSKKEVFNDKEITCVNRNQVVGVAFSFCISVSVCVCVH